MAKDSCSSCYSDENKLEKCADCTAIICVKCVYYAASGEVICPDCHAGDTYSDNEKEN